MSINWEECIIVACSTAETNRMQSVHSVLPGQELRDLAWMYLQCWRFNGLALLNFQGMTDPAYAQSASPIGTLQELLDVNAGVLGIGDWRREFGFLRGGPYLGGLRALLLRAGTPVWLEIASGSSRRVYAGLDVFVRTFAQRYSPNNEVRFLLYDRDVYPDERRVVFPWDWWYFPVWESCGQGEPNFEYTRDFADVLAERIVYETRSPLTVAAERCIGILARHVRAPAGRLALVAQEGEGTVARFGNGKGMHGKDGKSNGKGKFHKGNL